MLDTDQLAFDLMADGEALSEDAEAVFESELVAIPIADEAVAASSVALDMPVEGGVARSAA
jgi:hypothetical protein